jgi:MscS family membrane protein
VLDQIVLGNSVKVWGVAAAILIVSLVVGRLVSAFLAAVSKHMPTAVVHIIAEGIQGPIMTIVLLFGARVALESLVLPDGAKVLLANATTFLLVLVLTWLCARAYDAIHRGVLEPYASRPGSSVDLHLFVVLRIIVNTVTWVVGSASALNSVGFEVSAILAGLGIGGMALALASQDTVANLFGGLLVLTQRPFKIGDRVEVGSVNGWVTHIGLRNTLLRNWYGREVMVPNKMFTDSVVVNIDAQQLYYQEARLRLDPRSSAADVQKALQILADIVRELPEIDKTPWIMFDKIDHGHFEIEFWYGIPRWRREESATIPNEYEKICRAKSRMNLEILRRFEAACLRLAVPMEIHLKASGQGDEG